MSIYPDALHDDRVRAYLFAKRVLWSENATNPQWPVQSREIQPQVTAHRPYLVLREGGGILLDFGTELHGGIRLIGLQRCRVRIRFGESASEAMNTPNQDHAIHDTQLDLPVMGMLEYGNTAFRFVRVDVISASEPVTFLNLCAVALYRDQKAVGAFHSSDERLDRIWETAVYTVRLNMQDYIYDGVKRDRLVWMGDLNPEVRAIQAVFDDVSLVAKSLDFMTSHSDQPENMNEIRTYSFWWVLTLADYYWHTGDLTYLTCQKEMLAKLLPIFAAYVDEAGSEQVPPMRFLDWPNYDNAPAMHAGLQGLLYWTLRRGKELCRILDVTLPAEIDAALQRMVRHIPDCHNSKAAAAIQTLSGLADRTDVILRDPLHGISTFYGFYMLLAQPTRPALEVIRRYWGAMLDYGATTFWEDFDLDWIADTTPISELPQPGKKDLHADFGNYCYKGLRHSLCHGWAAGPAPFLSERVLGIRFLEPGGSKILVAPELGGLDFAHGAYPTKFGPVTIHADASGKLEVDAPSQVRVETKPVLA
ncbi:MAG: hypothetical protein PHS41_00845 [Victivallaceae bacterium]|nr:hypothetical protein [Victivallaceae bacterium]